jgi:DnaJ family protein C protein 2
VEKKNNAARKKRKNEDIARLRQLVDKCLDLDPRIKIFKEQERARRNAKKNAREAEERRLAEESKKKAEQDAKLKEEAEAAEKAAKANTKKAKEAAKQAVKKNRRVLKSSVKDCNYFVTTGGDPSPKDIDNVLGDVEFIQGKIDPDELAELVKKLSVIKGPEAVKATYKECAEMLVSKGIAKLEDFKAVV